jgi:hypothetical protein
MTKILRHSAIIASLLVMGHTPMAKSETMSDLTVKSNFKYKTQTLVKFDLQLFLPEPGIAGIVIYGDSEQGLRFLQSRITRPDGSFVGSMLIPSYLKEVKIQARYRDRLEEIVIPIVRKSVIATLDMTVM